MANENIDIRVREDGSRVVRRNLEEIGETSIRSASAVDLLKRALGGLGVGLAVAQFVRMLDVTTNINSRLRLVTNTTEELNAVYSELLNISNETRTGLEANVTLFSRVGQATKDLNLSYQQQLDFVRQLNLALQISGSNAVEGAAAMIQLSQGLASGTLRGEEFNSVAEQAPRILDALAESLGVSRGELRELAQDGKLSADTLIKAMSEAAPKLEAEFARIAPTVASAFTVLQNEVLNFIRTFNEGTAIGEILANTILFIASNVEVFAGGLAALAILITGAVIPAIVAMTAAMLANPIGLLVVAIAAATFGLAAFGDMQLTIAGQTVTVWQVVKAVIMTVVDVISMAYNAIATFASNLIGLFQPFFTTIASWLSDMVGWFRDGMATALTTVKTAINSMIGFFVGLVNAIGPAITEGIPALFRLAMATAVNIVIGAIQTIIGLFQEAFSKIGGILSSLPGAGGAAAALTEALVGSGGDELSASLEGLKVDTEALAKGVSDVGASIRTSFSESQVDYIGAVGDAIGGAGESLKNVFTTNLKEVTTATNEGTTAAELLNGTLSGESGLGAGLDKVGKGAGGAAKGVSDMNDQLERQKQILEETVGKRQEFVDQLSAVTALLSSGQITQGDAFGQVINSGLLNEDLFAGTQELLNMRVEQFRVMYEQINALRQADLISEQTARQALKQVDLLYMEERLSGQKALFGELAKLSKSGNRTLAAIGKAAAVTQATIDGYLAIQKALASYPPPMSYAIAAAIGLSTAANVASILSTNTNFATGGSFVVGGSGGVDSQMVAMRASPGERVTVQTPTQVRKGTEAANGSTAGGSAAPPQVNLRNINVLDPALVGDYLQTPEGEDVLVNVLSRSGVLNRRG